MSTAREHIIDGMKGKLGRYLSNHIIYSKEQLDSFVEKSETADIRRFTSKLAIGRLATISFERSLSEDGRTGRNIGIFYALEDGAGISEHTHTNNAEFYIGNQPFTIPNDDHEYIQQVCRAGEKHGMVNMKAGDMFIYEKVGVDNPNFNELIPPEMQSIVVGNQ